MSIAVPLYGFGASGGTGGTLTVTAPANVTVTVSKGGKTKTKNSGTGGVVVFKGLKSGTWTVTITGDGKTAQKNVVITTDYSTAISFNLSVGQQKVGTLFFASIECTRYASVRRILRNSTFPRHAAKCERAICKQSIASSAENRCNQEQPSITVTARSWSKNENFSLYGEKVREEKEGESRLWERCVKRVFSNSPTKNVSNDACCVFS